MNYTEFETAIYTRLIANWNEADADLIGEYFAKESSSGTSLEISIGAESDEQTFGSFDGGTKNLDIQSGTVNLLLSLPSDVGRTEALRLIGLARDLFHNYVNGYIKFSGAIKRNAGSQDGKLHKLIVCPFTVEIIE